MVDLLSIALKAVKKKTDNRGISSVILKMKGRNMYLIVGLGNPGNEYRMTRHNIGFETIDYIAAQHNVNINKLKFRGICGELLYKGDRLIFLKPQTYMNLSGSSVAECSEFYKIPPENIIVISDDTALERGRIRLRAKGGAGGHNGLKSVIHQLKTEEFPRIRVGIGSAVNANMELTDFVLGRFTKDEIPVMESAMIRASKAVFDIIDHDIDYAMNANNNNQ